MLQQKKLEILKCKQPLNGDQTPTPNLLANVSGIQPTLQQAPTQPDALNNAHDLSLALSLSNKPLTIPGAAAPENRNVNTNAGIVNISEDANNGRKVSVKDSWNACAAAFLGNFFLNYDKREINNGVKEPNLTIDIWGPSKDKMVSPNDNASSLQGLIQEGANRNLKLQLGVGQWNKHGGSSSKDASPSSSHVHVHVWPTRVISGQSVLPSQAASFLRRNELDTSLHGLGRTPYQHGDFLAFNNGPYTAQATHEQVLSQAKPYAPPPFSFGFSNLQMQLGQVNPVGTFPLQEPPKSSSAIEIPMESGMNYRVGRLQDRQTGEAIPLIILDDDEEPNLTLQL